MSVLDWCLHRLGLGILLIVAGALALPSLSAAATPQEIKAARDAARSLPAFASCRCAAVGFSVGQLAAEGPETLWLAHEGGVSEVLPEGRLEPVWKTPGGARLVRFDAADLDGDGRSEWVVLLDSGRLRSYVLRLGDSGWERGRPFSGFLRPMVDAEGSPYLLGQRRRRTRFHDDAIHRVRQDEKQRWTLGEEIAALRGLFVYDFQLIREPRPRLFVVDSEGGFSERDPSQSSLLLWSLDRPLASRPLEVEFSGGSMFESDDTERFDFAPALQSLDLDADGVDEILLTAGPRPIGVSFDSIRIHDGGNQLVFDLAEQGLTQSLSTPMLGLEMAASWAGDLGGELVWLGAVWTKAAGGFVKPETKLFRFDPKTGAVLAKLKVGTETPGPSQQADEPAPGAPELSY